MMERYCTFAHENYNSMQLGDINDDRWNHLLFSLDSNQPTFHQLSKNLQLSVVENESYRTVYNWIRQFVKDFSLPFRGPNDRIPLIDLKTSNKEIQNSLRDQLGPGVSSQLIYFLGEKSKIYQRLFLTEVKTRGEVNTIAGVIEIGDKIFNLLKGSFTETSISIKDITQLETIATARSGSDEKLNFDKEMSIVYEFHPLISPSSP